MRFDIMRIGKRCLVVITAAVLVLLGQSFSGPAYAHCDTLNGPVLQDARRALESGDIAPVLKWIRGTDEPIVRDAFKTTCIVRHQGDQARELADRYFFETIVRLHRANEGAPYEGLKPADSVPPLIVAADEALASGSAEALAREVSASVAEGVRRRFQLALQRRLHAEESAEAGRAFVSAYVDYVHFIEGVTTLGAGETHRQGSGEGPHGHRP